MLLGRKVVDLDRMVAENIENVIMEEVLRWWKQRKLRTHILSPNPLQSWSLDPLETPEPPQTETVTKTVFIISVYITYITYIITDLCICT